MDVTLLSGVVRNRRMVVAVSRTNSLFSDGTEASDRQQTPVTWWDTIWTYLGKNAICRKFKLRVHKFSFQWDLLLHLSICIGSLSPFLFTGDRRYTWFPLVVWAFYNSLVIIGPRYSSSVIPGFGILMQSFRSTIEDFFSPKLLPVLSISFLLVALSLIVTGRRLGGPPLCYQSCGECLARWSRGVILDDARAATATDFDLYRVGCGYANGKELLGLYTMAQTSFLLFLTVVVAMAVCLGWLVAAEERIECNEAVDWLRRQDPRAFELRNEIVRLYGHPASSIRPEGSITWVFYGVTAALSFTLLGWHNWYVLPPSHTATLLIVLNLLTILMTLLILHLGFFGRLLALYKRNFLRVEYLTTMLNRLEENDIDFWWNCRNFVLNDDLSLDYDIGGLAVSVTFLINLLLFVTLAIQIYRDGSTAMYESPGSYCAYACMYLTSCLIKLFTLATKTYEEQHRHSTELQRLSSESYGRAMVMQGDATPLSGPTQSLFHDHHTNWQVNEQDLSQLIDDGPMFIDDVSTADDSQSNEHTELLPPKIGNQLRRQGSNSAVSSPRQPHVARFNFIDTVGTVVNNTRNLWTRPTVDATQSVSGSVSHNNLAINQGMVMNNESSNSRLRLQVDAESPQRGDIEMSLHSYSQDGSSNSPRSPKSPKQQTSPPLHSANSNSSSQSQSQQSPRGGGNLSLTPPPPPLVPCLVRASSGGMGHTADTYRNTLAEFVQQIKKYDPVPCILGIPIMPDIFNFAKAWIFTFFFGMGIHIFVSFLGEIKKWQ